MRVLVVLPALNEAESLRGLLAELDATILQSGLDAQVLVVDDASTDQTVQVAEQHGARVIQLSRNLGIGGAVQTGFLVAQREGFDVAVQMDSDGQHPPEQLSRLLSAFEQSPAPDMVVGSRYIQKDGFQSTRLRRMGIAWLSLVIRVLSGKKYHDPTSGYRAFGRRALRLFSRSYPYDYPEPEALILASAAGLVVKEVPVQMRPRSHGWSSIRFLDAPYYMVKVTAAVILSFLRRHRHISGRTEG